MRLALQVGMTSPSRIDKQGADESASETPHEATMKSLLAAAIILAEATQPVPPEVKPISPEVKLPETTTEKPNGYLTCPRPR